MPSFRNEFGKFISGAEAESRAAQGQPFFRALFGSLIDVPQEAPEQFEPGDEEPGFYADPNWSEYEQYETLIWTADGDALEEAAFEDFPDGYSSFQVRYIVPASPSYPRGYASNTVLTSGSWPPTYAWGRSKGATGIGAIVFYR
jgi:hypothetical protein